MSVAQRCWQRGGWRQWWPGLLLAGLVVGTSLLAPLASASAATTSVQSGPWSAPTTWSTGRVPGAGDFVVVSPGTIVTYDVSATTTLAQVSVEGTLTFTRTRSTRLDVGLLLVEPSGHLEVGSETNPIPDGVTATIRLTSLSGVTYQHLHGSPTLPPALHTHGGILDLHGAPRQATWTLLTQDAPAATTRLTVADDVRDWRPGDKIVLTGTNKMYVKGQTAATRTLRVDSCNVRTRSFTCLDPTTFQAEEATIAAVAGNTLTLTAPLKYPHLGTSPRQAAVGLLSRNVVITSTDPNGRRGHVMIAHGFVVADSDPLPAAIPNPVTARLSYVEFAHLGRPEPGFYPVHFHRLGNEGRRSYLHGAAIHHSQNLFVRVHTTNSLTVADTVGYLALGHGYATEDGTEMYNVFHHNLASRTQHAAATNLNDLTDVNEGSGFWLNNPLNALTANYAADADAWSYQIDPLTTEGDAPQGKIIPIVDEDGTALPSVPVTTLPILAFADNHAYGGYFGGAEMINLDTLDENVLTNFHAMDGRIANFALFGTHFVLDNLYAAGGGPTWPGQHEYADNFAYGPGNFLGVKLSRQPQHQVRSSYLENVRMGYQFDGALLLKDTEVGILRNTSYGANTLWAITGQPRFDTHTLDIQSFPPNSTTQHEVYLFDHDGPGQHVKLTPLGTVPADTLSYRPSPRFQQFNFNPRYSYQEAAFTGPATEGPPLRLPFFIDAGARQNVVNAAAGGHDLVDTQGARWALDNPYMASPPGYYLPRYGSTNATAYGSDYTSIYGSMAAAGLTPMLYRIDVPNGTYWVDLHFIELNFPDLPWTAKTVGSRVFDVYAEEVQVLSRLDVFQAVGNYVPLVHSFPVEVRDGQLTLRFSPRGMVAGIALCPLDDVVQGRCTP